MLTGTNLVHAKQHNLRIVHEAIRLHGPVSRADVARRTELTGQTVSNLVKELMELGLVHEAAPRHRREGRGAPSTVLAINPDGAYAVGLDLDRDHLTGVLVDLEGSVRQRVHHTLDTPSPAEALDLMAGAVERLLADHALPAERLWGIGVGVPGPMRQSDDGTGYLVNPKAFAGWHEVPLARLLGERIGVPVLLENNATAAAVGERWYGAGRAIDTFFYVYFGSGLGGGLIVDGRPFEGFTGNAGELGYLPPFPTAHSPAGGREVSHVGLHFNLPRLYETLRADGAVARTPEELDTLYGARHPRLLDWIDTAAEHLARLVLTVEYVIDPAAIFFGGRLPDRIVAGLMERVARELPALRIPGKETAPRLLLATAGVDAAALGVATLPLYGSFAPATHHLLKQPKQGGSPGLRLPRGLAAG